MACFSVTRFAFHLFLVFAVKLQSSFQAFAVVLILFLNIVQEDHI